MAHSNNNIITNVTGGINGTTNSTAMTNFPANGATKGAAGLVDVANTLASITCTNDTICPGNTASLQTTATNLVGATIEWYDAAIGGNLLATGSTFTTPALSANTDYYVRVCPLPYRAKASVIMQTATSNNVSAGADINACNASTANLHGSYTLAGSTGLWTSIGNSLSITNPTDSNATIASLPIGSFTLVYTVTNGCIISSDTLLIQNNTPNATPFAGTDQSVCGSSATLNATAISNAIWSSSTAGVSIANSASANSAVSNLVAGENVFIYATVSNNACPAATDTVVVHADFNPDVANAGSDQVVCSSSASLSTTVPLVGTVSWSALGNSASIANPSAASTAVSGLALGTSQFVLSISNGICPVSTDTISIQVNQVVNAVAGSDQTICADTAQLLATSTTPMGVWSSVGAAIITSNNNQAQVSNLQAGNNYFVWTISIPGCAPSQDTMNVIRNLAPSTAQAGTDITICGNTTTISASPASVGSLLWSSSNNVLVFSNPTSASCTVSNLQGGINTLVLTISNGVCPPSVDTLLITRSNVNIANAGFDKNTCADTITLHAINTGSVGTWNSLGTATLSANNVLNPFASNLQNGVNLFVYTVSASGGCPAASDTVKIVKQNAPDAASAGADKSTCSNSVILQASAPVSGIGQWFEVGTTTAEIFNVTDPLTRVDSLKQGSYQFVWRVSRPGCSITKSDTVLVRVFVADTNMKAMNDTTLTPGVPVNLSASGASTYEWNPATDLSCATCASPVFTGITDVVYVVTMSDVHGCQVQDSVIITTSILKFVEIADVFSPNAADEINRTFKIHHVGLKEIDLNLFNEFGELVFSITGDSFNKQWDGTINGNPAKSGAYVYYYSALYLDRTTEKKSGKVLLLR